ncbi:MAG: hypothetical protein ABJ004_06115 [Cyclobacteriaceae bacterium]
MKLRKMRMTVRKFHIVNALIWAFVILVISMLIREPEYHKYLLYVVVFAAGTQASLLASVKYETDNKSCHAPDLGQRI